MKFSAIFVFILLVVLGASPLKADEIIFPMGTFTGKHADSAMRAVIPESGFISDQATLDNVWSSLAIRLPKPGLDWSSDLVLIDSVGGQNQMRVSPLRLDENNDLKFACASTRMAGPGLGYAIVLIKRGRIQTVNGNPIPGAAAPTVQPPAMPANDSVLVSVVGKLQTGIMAIGGETTGTIIRSGNITFEVDLSFDRGLKRVAESLNGKRVGIKGQLVKKQGVEIRERWILKATSVEAVADVGIPKPAPAPGKASFKEIKFGTSGGIAGLDEELTVSPDGNVTKVNRRRRVTESWRMTPERLAKLNALIAKLDLNKIPQGGAGNSIPDGMSYQFTISTDKDVFHFSRNDGSLARSTELSELSKLLQQR